MADTAISALTSATAIAAADVFPLVQSGTTKKATYAVLQKLLIGGVQSLSGAGAVDVTNLVTKITTTGANALTLADGAEGQVKILVMIVDGGDGTLTPTNLANGSTVTFNDAGDSCVLVFLGTEWFVAFNNGCTVA